VRAVLGGAVLLIVLKYCSRATSALALDRKVHKPAHVLYTELRAMRSRRCWMGVCATRIQRLASRAVSVRKAQAALRW
jgi:hypothetical protein